MSARTPGSDRVLIFAMAASLTLAGASGQAPPASAPRPPKGAAKSPARSALPAAVRDACDAAATILKTFPGASVDRPDGPVEDPHSTKKRPGCGVHARGTFAALKDTPLPDVRLGTWFVERGWKENPEYDADGPDGTAFGYEREKVLCFVSVHWDGGDDSDPDAVPEDWFEVRIGCVANGPDAPGKP